MSEYTVWTFEDAGVTTTSTTTTTAAPTTTSTTTTTAAPAPEAVVWTNLTSATNDGGGTITSTSTNGRGVGTKYIPSGEDGYVEFRFATGAAPNSEQCVIGLDSTGSSSEAFTGFSFGVYGNLTPKLYTAEEGTLTDSGIGLTDDDILRLELSSGNIIWKRSTDGGSNFTTIKTETAAAADYYVKCDLLPNNASLFDCKILNGTAW